MFSKLQLLALLGATATAAPTPQESGSSDQQQPFSLLSFRSGDEAVHQKAIQANNGAFYIGGRMTDETCAAGVTCTNVTALTYDAAETTVFMDDQAPGGQQVYIEGAGGALKFVAPHDNVPADSVTTNFTWVPPQGSTLGRFYTSFPILACPTDTAGEYQIYTEIGAGSIYSNCTEIDVVGGNYTGTQAYEYP